MKNERSVFSSLKYPSKFKAIPNEQEELFIIGWSIIEPEVNRLLDKGTTMSRKGIEPGSTFEAANYLFYLVHYAINIRNYAQLFGDCVDLSRCKIDCVEDNLTCLSANMGVNLKDAWYKLKEAFGITDDQLCGDCCEGIGQMIIEGDECNGFIINTCEDK